MSETLKVMACIIATGVALATWTEYARERDYPKGLFALARAFYSDTKARRLVCAYVGSSVALLSFLMN